MRERNINGLPLVCAPTGDRPCNLEMCPDWETNPRPCGLLRPTEPRQPGPTLSLFIPSSISSRLGCFRIPAVMNNAAVGIGVQVLLRDSYLIASGSVPRSGIAGSQVSPAFNFWRTFPVAPVHVSTNRAQAPSPPPPRQHSAFVFRSQPL